MIEIPIFESSDGHLFRSRYQCVIHETVCEYFNRAKCLQKRMACVDTQYDVFKLIVDNRQLITDFYASIDKKEKE